MTEGNYILTFYFQYDTLLSLDYKLRKAVMCSNLKTKRN